MTRAHKNQLNSPEAQTFAEVAMEPELAAQALDMAMSLQPGVYEEDLAARGHFLMATGAIGEIIQESVVGAALADLREGRTVALRITGVPRDPNLPPSPPDGGAPMDKHTFASEGLALAMSQVLGAPSLIVGEKKEELVHQITPVAGREETQSNEGAVDLKLHQDLAPNADLPNMPYSEFMADWLILTGLRAGNGEQTGTYIASLDEALASVSPEAQQLLGERRFVTDPPDSFLKEIGSEAPEPPVHPVLSVGETGYMEAAFDTSSNVRPVDPEDKEGFQAIEELEAALMEVRKEVVIEPGTSVIFNNRRTVHGRGAISVPTSEHEPSSGKRWLQRVYVYDPGRVVRQAASRTLAIGMGGGLLTVYRVPPERIMEMMRNSI
jgi:L-asparagine oxygenase